MVCTFLLSVDIIKMNYQIKDVELEITNICSHKCPYCYNGNDSTVNPHSSDFNTLCAIVDKMNLVGAKRFILLGGDPVEYPRIVELLRYIKKNGMSVTLMSNTLNFHDYDIEVVSEYIDEIQFTLHGTTGKEHEEFCKAPAGTYPSIFFRLKKFYDIGTEVNIAINIIPQTYSRVYDMINLFHINNIKPKKLYLQRIIPCGRAQDSSEFNIVKEQINVMLKSLDKIEKDFRIEIIMEDPYPLCYVNEKYYKYFSQCPEGIDRIAIRGDGQIGFCSASTNSGIGNVLSDSYNQFWVNNPYFVSIREGLYMTNERCKKCKIRKKCRGGCPIQYILAEKNGNNFYDKFE